MAMTKGNRKHPPQFCIQKIDFFLKSQK